MRQIKNGSLYFDANEKRIVRVRSKLNSSSVNCSKPHSDDLVAVKASDLDLLPMEETDSYLKEAGVV